MGFLQRIMTAAAPLLCGLACTLPNGQAQAADPQLDADFFAGKRLTYIVGTAPGGGYDNYARLIAKYLPRHLGIRAAFVRNVPGASHLIGLHALVNAEPDGLTIGTFNTGLLMSSNPLSIDLRELSWIGKAASETRIFVVAKKEPPNEFEDLRRHDHQAALYATSGLLGASHLQMMLIGQAFQMHIRPVHGFSGSETLMVVLRGDVMGSLMSLTRVEAAIMAGKLTPLFYLGHPRPKFPVPPLATFAETDAQRALAKQLSSMTELGRLTAAPPDLGPDRLNTLRNAYFDTLSDPELLAEAERLNMPIDAWHGSKVEHEIATLPQLAEIAQSAEKSANMDLNR